MQVSQDMEHQHRLLKYLRREILPSTHCPGCGCGQVLNSFANSIDDLRIDPDEIISDYRWVPVDELPNLAANLGQLPLDWAGWGQFRAPAHQAAFSWLCENPL